MPCEFRNVKILTGLPLTAPHGALVIESFAANATVANATQNTRLAKNHKDDFRINRTLLYAYWRCVKHARASGCV